MPIVQDTFYPGFPEPGPIRGSAHISTIWASVFRRVSPPRFERTIFTLADDDFLELDWIRGGAERIAIVSHGLEGSTRSRYVSGIANALAGSGWDVLAWNMRGCGGTPNRKLGSYHSGLSSDLAEVVSAVAQRGIYSSIHLIGFSLGGNITLKYLGENPERVPASVRASVNICAPCDLRGCAIRMARPIMLPYMRAFLKSFRSKLEAKALQFPAEIDLVGFENIRTFQEYDDRYTAPVHGFLDAEDYWRRSSSLQFMPAIRLPTLLVTPENDPFLSESCRPRELAAGHPHIFLETPRYGGHIGFNAFRSGFTWLEMRVLAWISECERRAITG